MNTSLWRLYRPFIYLFIIYNSNKNSTRNTCMTHEDRITFHASEAITSDCAYISQELVM